MFLMQLLFGAPKPFLNKDSSNSRRSNNQRQRQRLVCLSSYLVSPDCNTTPVCVVLVGVRACMSQPSQVIGCTYRWPTNFVRQGFRKRMGRRESQRATEKGRQRERETMAYRDEEVERSVAVQGPWSAVVPHSCCTQWLELFFARFWTMHVSRGT